MTVRIVAKEQGSGESSLALEPAEGTEPDIQPGQDLEIVLDNHGDEIHDLHVTTGEKADGSHEETSPLVSLTDIGPVQPGSTGQTTVPVPEVETLYFWCGLGHDEAHGMWMEVPVAGGEGAPS